MLENFKEYVAQEIDFSHINEQSIERILKTKNNLHHDQPYAEEQVFMNAIRYGNMETVNQYMKILHHKCPLVIADKPFKNAEYMAICFITIVSRAAIEVGATPEESFLISNYYLKQISNCQSEEDIKWNLDKAAIDFVELVKKYAKYRSSNYYVENSKKYIINNIEKKISLSDVSETLRVNSSYLSKLFSKTEGITISEYIQREKVNVAKDMLKVSDKSINEISMLLNMHSHSYFSYIFKKYIGITPKEYRVNYQSTEL